MGLTKCPRCELNYILDGGDLCTVCREEVRGKSADDGIALCSVCGELPAASGEDMCRSCLKEIRLNEAIIADNDDDSPVDSAELAPEPVSSLDEIEATGEIDEDAEKEEELTLDIAFGDEEAEDTAFDTELDEEAIEDEMDDAE